MEIEATGNLAVVKGRRKALPICNTNADLDTLGDVPVALLHWKYLWRARAPFNRLVCAHTAPLIAIVESANDDANTSTSTVPACHRLFAVLPTRFQSASPGAFDR
jgi:hypothetical protein